MDLIKKIRYQPSASRSYWLTIIFMLLALTNLSGQSLELNWSLQTDGRIVAGPVIDESKAYVGNEKGKFLAIDLKTGQPVWEVETAGNIQAKAVLIDDLVFFESANTFYSLNKENGEEVWKYSRHQDPEKFALRGVDYLYKLDPFDDKRSSGFVHNGIIYVGTSHGKVLGLNAKSGSLEFSFMSDDQAPIRATPLVHEGKLYYGDWNGKVYCYDLKNRSQLWRQKTYDEKPYATFGGIASEFIEHQGKLFFGARNPMLKVLRTEDGQADWSYTDAEGGWLIGDPVIMYDTLYIGGSDNFSMLAFDAANGKLLWKNKRTKNIYGKPIVSINLVIYSTGNAYNPKDKGEIVMLERITGNSIAEYEIPSNAFSSPVLAKDQLVIFGSTDGTLYSLRIRR